MEVQNLSQVSLEAISLSLSIVVSHSDIIGYSSCWQQCFETWVSKTGLTGYTRRVLSDLFSKPGWVSFFQNFLIKTRVNPTVKPVDPVEKIKK